MTCFNCKATSRVVVENSEGAIKETMVSENQVSLQIYILTTMCLYACACIGMHTEIYAR